MKTLPDIWPRVKSSVCISSLIIPAIIVTGFHPLWGVGGKGAAAFALLYFHSCPFSVKKHESHIHRNGGASVNTVCAAVDFTPEVAPLSLSDRWNVL